MKNNEKKWTGKPFSGKKDPLLDALKKAHGDLYPRIDTLEAVGEVYKPLLDAHDKRKDNAITTDTFEQIGETPRKKIKSILQTMCDEYSISMDDLIAKKKTVQGIYNGARHPRHIAAYLLKKITGKSFKTVGRIFGNRDNSTIMYSCKLVEDKMAEDPAFKTKVEELESRVRKQYEDTKDSPL